jgi:gas vesicle protein
MANEYDYEGGGGSGFMMGLLTGTVLGAGLGMLFAPKSGSELRNQISEGASSAKHAASDQYRRASEAAGHLAEKGREVVSKARDVVSRGTDEARRYADDAARKVGGTTGSGPTGPGGSSPYSTGS